MGQWKVVFNECYVHVSIVTGCLWICCNVAKEHFTGRWRTHSRSRTVGFTCVCKDDDTAQIERRDGDGDDEKMVILQNSIRHLPWSETSQIFHKWKWNVNKLNRTPPVSAMFWDLKAKPRITLTKIRGFENCCIIFRKILHFLNRNWRSADDRNQFQLPTIIKHRSQI